MLTYGQNTSQNVSYMTFWDETVLNSHLKMPLDPYLRGCWSR